MFPRVLTLQMDYHKTLPSPKISSQDFYYARKLKTNLFGIYCANEDIIHCFFYDETIAESGPNEVISLLNFLLKSVQEKYGRFHHLILWADTSPGQFKECYLFFYLDYLVKRGHFLRIDFTFFWRAIHIQSATGGLVVFSNFLIPKKKLKHPNNGHQLCATAN